MTSKELIAELQRIDPEGNIDVCVDNQPIYFLEKAPAYWDGKLGRLIEDPALKGKAYSIIGYEIVSSGSKIKIRTIGLGDVLFEDPDLPVTYNGSPAIGDGIEATRATYKKIIREIEEDHLISSIITGKKARIERALERLELQEKPSFKWRLNHFWKYYLPQLIKQIRYLIRGR